MKKFPSEVSEQLRSYVYLYSDPRNGQPFYVGKGVGDRVFSHLEDENDSKKVKKIKELRSDSREPKIEMLRFGLSDDQATLLEAAIIDLLGLKNLTNKVHGEHSRSFGRVTVGELLSQKTAKPAKIEHPALLITINRLYRSDMSSRELLEATRGIWKLGKRREKAEIAMAVYQGIVREVYRIKSWHQAGTLIYKTRDGAKFKGSGRWEFDGEVAEDFREQYSGKSVGKSGQNPIRYVKC
jgi:hypothetical protein